jgi:hypothetical protein
MIIICSVELKFLFINIKQIKQTWYTHNLVYNDTFNFASYFYKPNTQKNISFVAF